MRHVQLFVVWCCLVSALTLEHLGRWEYATPQELSDDVRQVFTNCRRYNAPDQEVVVMGNTLEVLWLQLSCSTLVLTQLGADDGPCSPSLTRSGPAPWPPSLQRRSTHVLLMRLPFETLSSQSCR